MVNFKRKKLKKIKRVCLRLKDARKAADLSIDDMVKKTRLEKKFIVALEECKFDELPKGDVYRKQFIKTYLRALGVAAETYLLQYHSEEAERKVQLHPHKIVSKKYFQNIPAIFRFAGVGIVALVLVLYLGLQVRRIIEPPLLLVHSPDNGMVTDDFSLVVQGKTDKEVAVTINGIVVPPNTSGQFNERVDLAPGMNTITVTAKRKHGKTTTEIRHVILREGQAISYNN